MSKTVLQPAELHALLRTFKEQHAGEHHLLALGYFGSYARNEATPESDVDVVFQTDRPDLFITAMLRQDLETFLDHSVDVVRLRDSMNPRSKSSATGSLRQPKQPKWQRPTLCQRSSAGTAANRDEQIYARRGQPH